jgi:molybdopterin/thiamine biosynthesis adenylyltransferase
MLNDADLERYARQVIMPDLGESGQEALLAARIIIVGAGGLGAPVILYLAAAGIGSLTLVDDDAVSRTDLNRQVIYQTDDVGREKVARATVAAKALNPDITIIPHAVRVDDGNISQLVTGHDVIIDCSDNVETRYLLGDIAHRQKIPLVFGGAVRTEGQLAVFQSGGAEFEDNPCFRCVFPAMPDASQAPGCSEAGILGPITGVIGAMQALEAIKLVAGVGSSLTGRLLLFDGHNGSFMEIATSRRRECACCGQS